MDLTQIADQLFGKDWSPGIAVVGAFLAAVFAWRAARQADSVSRTTANQYASELALRADELFKGEGAKLRQYFFKNKKVPKRQSASRHEATAAEVDSAAETYLDVLEAIVDHRNRYEGRDFEAWREWIHELMGTAPSMRDLYADNYRSYPAIAHMVAEGVCTRPAEHEWPSLAPGKLRPVEAGTLVFHVIQATAIGLAAAALTWLATTDFGLTKAEQLVPMLVTGAAVGAAAGAIRTLFRVELARFANWNERRQTRAVHALAGAVLATSSAGAFMAVAVIAGGGAGLGLRDVVVAAFVSGFTAGWFALPRFPKKGDDGATESVAKAAEAAAPTLRADASPALANSGD